MLKFHSTQNLYLCIHSTQNLYLCNGPFKLLTVFIRVKSTHVDREASMLLLTLFLAFACYLISNVAIDDAK